MRKVILKMEVTLDGLIGGPNGEMDWALPQVESKDQWKDVMEMLGGVDGVLLSRVLYQGFKQYWPPVAKDPSNPKSEREFSKWLDAVPKYVFSRTLKKVDWTHSLLVKGDLAKEIGKLKRRPGKNFVLWGGAKFAQAFLREGLIDEVRLNVHPVVLGAGKPLFEGLRKRIGLKLMRLVKFRSGVTGLRYQVVKK